MTHFKGTHLVRRDGKGRVSIPAAFRAVLKGDPAANAALVLLPSHKYPCIEGWHPASFAAQGNQIQQLPRFSDEEDDLALALYSDAVDAEPDREGRIVLPRNLAVQIFRALLENAASEQGSRMTAMDNATRNAGDMINRLTITYNRTRQAAITKELIEIISGAEAI